MSLVKMSKEISLIICEQSGVALVVYSDNNKATPRNTISWKGNVFGVVSFEELINYLGWESAVREISAVLRSNETLGIHNVCVMGERVCIGLGRLNFDSPMAYAVSSTLVRKNFDLDQCYFGEFIKSLPKV